MFDANKKCGGSVIGERFLATARHCTHHCTGLRVLILLKYFIIYVCILVKVMETDVETSGPTFYFTYLLVHYL